MTNDLTPIVALLRAKRELFRARGGHLDDLTDRRLMEMHKELSHIVGEVLKNLEHCDRHDAYMLSVLSERQHDALLMGEGNA